MPKTNSDGPILAVVGSRGWVDREKIFAILDNESPARIVSGGALGVDSIAEAWALDRGVPCEVIRPDYKSHGRGAPLIRNEEIIDRSDSVLAFWDGKSRGTAFVIQSAQKKGKNVKVIS